MKSEKPSPASSLRLDTVNQCLWSGTRNITLTPKAFLVLRCLMDRPGQLVTKEELLNTAWPEVYVSDAALKVCIRRLRQALGDESQVPRFIETIPWRGYRFIGTVDQQPEENGQQSVTTQSRTQQKRLHTLSQRHMPGQRQAPTRPGAARLPLIPRQDHKSASLLTPHSLTSAFAAAPTAAPYVVGRDNILSQIHSLLPLLLQGKRQIVFLTGEPGIGKTAVVDAFLARVFADVRFWTVSGQCIERYGTGEPYLPILEALERLCRLPGNARLIAILRQYAPMWLVQMPTLISATEQKRLRRTLQGTSSDRMLREFADALTHLTAEKPLVLSIEDLHWSDSATLDLLSFLTRRHQHSRLLFLGTYRPGVVTENEHPLPSLIRELSTHEECYRIPLGLLDAEAVLTYVTSRFPAGDFLPTLARAVYQRTEGNPLFMVNVVEYLLAQGILRQEHGRWQLHAEGTDIHAIVPTNVQQLLEMQIDRLPANEQQMLEVASVAGMEFSAATVAAALDIPIPTAEEHYTKLTRRFHFLRSLDVSEWPDGTVAQQYAFIHSLYQQVFYQRIPAGKRTQLHARIGQQQELAYGAQAAQIAVELAMHFERGRDFRRAVQYRHHAAEMALQRYAYREAIEHLTIGLELLKATPSSEERVQQEIVICSALGAALTTTQGYASVAVKRTYSRAHALWQHAGITYQPFPVLLGLWGFSQVRAELATALTQAQQLLELANAAQDPLLLSRAHNALGATLFWQGNLVAAKQHYEDSSAIYDPSLTLSADCVHNPGVISLSSLSVIFAYCGDVTQAHRRATEALTLIQQHEHDYSLALARCHIAAMHQVSRDFSATQEMATTAMALATEKGFPYCLACSTIQYGWARAMQTRGREGIEQLSQGIAAYQATGAALWQAYFLSLLAEAQLVAGQTSACLHTVTEGLTLAQARGQLLAEADLYRIKGDLLLAQKGRSQKLRTPDPQIEAEGYFLRSLEIARAQQARTLEFRVAIRLGRLWRHRGKIDLARQTLTSLCERFGGEPSTTDLQEVQLLLRSFQQAD